MPDIIEKNSSGNVAVVRILDADGIPKTGVAYNATGLEIYYTPKGGTPVQITLSAANWTETKHGNYEVDVQDEAFEQDATVEVSGVITDGVVIGDTLVVVGWNKIDGVNVYSVAGTAQTAGDIAAILAAIKGVGWTTQTLVSLQAAVAAIDPLDATETQAAAAAAITAASLPTASQIDTQLSGAHGDGSWESASTGGIYTQAVTVTSDGSAAIPNATVAIYSGSTLVDLKTTNSSGVATPTCDAGTYTLRVTASGYASHSAALTVAGDATVGTITLSAITVTPSTTGHVTGYVVCDGPGAIEGLTHDLEIVDLPVGTDGLSLPSGSQSAVSGVDGLVQWANIPWGANVRIKRQGGQWWGPYTAPTSGDTWEIRGTIGKP